MSDYIRKSIDLSNLLPKQLQDKTLNTLLKSVFNKQLTKQEYNPLIGTVGDISSDDIEIKESTLEKKINQLSPVLYVKHGTEEVCYTWDDIVKKMTILGIDVDNIDIWSKSNSFNFVPGIDIDKFSNFNQYYWVGDWVKNNPSIDFSILGIPSTIYSSAIFSRCNIDYKPEYYVIQRQNLSGQTPVALYQDFDYWNDWSLSNLWVHKLDLLEFVSTQPGILSLDNISQAKRPIIEYFHSIKLNSRLTSDGIPSDVGILTPQQKNSFNQPPQFDIYDNNQVHTGVTSPIFYYKESQDSLIDNELDRRIVKDVNNDFIFNYALLTQEDKLLFFKQNNQLSSCWVGDVKYGSDYTKIDTNGLILNTDKLLNYSNYFWTGIDHQSHPVYNINGNPEYVVIEAGGISDWSKYNAWKHVSVLDKNRIGLYINATEPIIEFNNLLESELILQKNTFAQQPKFKKYKFDQLTSSYVLQFQNNTLNDYLNGFIVSNIKNIPNLSMILDKNSNLRLKTFEVDNNVFIEGFDSLNYNTSINNIDCVYTPLVSFSGVGDGSINGIIPNQSVFIPTVYKLRFNGNQFEITNGINSTIEYTTTGSLFNNGFISFTIVNGVNNYAINDTFIIDVTTNQIRDNQIYIKLGSTYKTFDNSNQINNDRVLYKEILADKSLKNGIWKTPPQLNFNLFNETQTEFKHGDLFNHFTSIIKSQEFIIGNEQAENNFRNLQFINYGYGGTIRQFNDNFSIFLGIILQNDITVDSLLSFGKIQYSNVLNNIVHYIENTIADSISTNISYGLLDFINYNSNFSDINGIIVNGVLSDSSNPINNIIATLPFLGLCEKVLPYISLDHELNILMMTHHDGHKSSLYKSSVDLLKKIVTKEYKRSNGQHTQGVITAISLPSRPFAKQFCFKTTTNTLMYFDVVSDTGDKTSTVNNSFSFNRENGELFKYDGLSWQYIGNSVNDLIQCWKELDVSKIVNDITLELELSLFDKCPNISSQLDVGDIITNTKFTQTLQHQFHKFGKIHNIYDLYSINYDVNNPFTWNYSNASQWPMWYDIYQQNYGTSRPDLEPWVITNQTKSQFLSDVGLNLLQWTPSVINKLKQYLQSQNKNTSLSVDLATGELLPPFAHGKPEQFFNVIPYDINKDVVFGENGPFESLWKSSIDFNYDILKTYFRLSPLVFINKTFGIEDKSIGLYTLQQTNGRKLKPELLKIHGESISRSSSDIDVDVNVLLQQINLDTKYSFKYFGFGIFSVYDKNSIHIGFLYENTQYSNQEVLVSINIKNIQIGDVINVDISINNIDITKIQNLKNINNGLFQYYSQYLRVYNTETNNSFNNSLLKDYKIKLGYRFNGLINNNSLNVDINNNLIDPKNYKVLLKENKFVDNSWFQALNISLVHRGSTIKYNNIDIPRKNTDSLPGDDWVFRIDNFNNSTGLSWFTYDEALGYQSFYALDAKLTNQEWRRYKSPNNLIIKRAPFLITGLQNVVNFLFGYSDFLTNEGWIFTNPELTETDLSGRLRGIQLSIEEFINQQFSGVNNGSSYLFDIGKNKIWFKTPRGVVAKISNTEALDDISSSYISDIQGSLIKELRLFRNDEITQITTDSNNTFGTVHINISEYEHILLLDNYTTSTLIFDPILGLRIKKIGLSADKQLNFNGRLSFGGHVLHGNDLIKNLESSVENIIDYYDVDKFKPYDNKVNYTTSLVGFDSKQYFRNLNVNSKSEFRFWQGLLKHRGTNLAVDAFTNSKHYKTSELDEYWAYKIGQYGNYGNTSYPEFRIFPEDVLTSKSIYSFKTLNEIDINPIAAGEYDRIDYDVAMYDAYESSSSNNIEPIDQRGSITVRSSDDSRWYSYNDLETFTGFNLYQSSVITITPQFNNQVFEIVDKFGEVVIADYFEIVDNFDIRYYENGEYDQNTRTYSTPSFIRINASCIKVTNPAFINKTITIKSYTQNVDRYSPISLFDSKNNVKIKDFILWDPARNSHDESISNIDHILANDPAIYNLSKISTGNNLSVWTDEKLGVVWWNTRTLKWKPYSDTKLFNLNDRLGMWGSIADYSSIEIYEWTKSNIKPNDIKDFSNGEPANKKLLSRTRKWYQQPIVWLYSNNPMIDDRTVVTFDSDLILSSTEIGSAKLYSELRIKTTGLDKIDQISNVEFSSILNKNISTKFKPLSLLTISDKNEKFVVGDLVSAQSGGMFIPNLRFDSGVCEINNLKFANRSDSTIGKFVISYKIDASNNYSLIMKCVATNEIDTISINDSPNLSSSKIILDFSKFGIQIKFNVLFDHIDIPITEDRKLEICNFVSSVDIVVRSCLDVFNETLFNSTTLNKISSNTTSSWVGFKLPTQIDIQNDFNSPYNKWEYRLGDKTDITNNLVNYSKSIKNKSYEYKFKNKSLLNRFSFLWGEWNHIKDLIISKRLLNESPNQFFRNNFSVDKCVNVSVYRNNILQNDQQYYVDGVDDFIGLNEIDVGDLMTIKLKCIKPSKDLLELFDSNKDEPTDIIQYSYEFDYTEKVSYNEYGTKNTTFYFWMKNKTAIPNDKNESIINIAKQLEHKEEYTILQGLKYYDQDLGSSAKHMTLIVNNLNNVCSSSDNYKIRINDNPSLRNNSYGNLKNIHQEWILLSRKQNKKIPVELWNLLTNSLCGNTISGNLIPSYDRSFYDDKYNSNVAYGTSSGQSLVDGKISLVTFKYILQNPTTYKYDIDSVKYVDRIDFDGFDINKIDDYLNSPQSIRKLMSDIWDNATPKQINDVFFELLNDALSQNLEIYNLFKTSYISLSDVRFNKV